MFQADTTTLREARIRCLEAGLRALPAKLVPQVKHQSITVISLSEYDNDAFSQIALFAVDCLTVGDRIEESTKEVTRLLLKLHPSEHMIQKLLETRWRNVFV